MTDDRAFEYAPNVTVDPAAVIGHPSSVSFPSQFSRTIF
jgi:hypothetical protein